MERGERGKGKGEGERRSGRRGTGGENLQSLEAGLNEGEGHMESEGADEEEGLHSVLLHRTEHP